MGMRRRQVKDPPGFRFTCVPPLLQCRAMHAVLNVALPVFAIMLAGYLAGRFGVLGPQASEVLNRFVYYAALPALFVVSMARVPAGEVFNLNFIGVFFGAQILTWAVAMVVAQVAFRGGAAEVGLHGLSAIFSNTGYMGIPLLILAFGDDGTLPAIIATVINGAFNMALGIAIIEMDRSKRSGAFGVLRDVAVGVVRSPLVLSAVGGLAWSSTGWPLPTPVENFCTTIGAAASPAALFSMGLFLVGRKVTAGLGEVSWLVLLKLVVNPLFAWWLAANMFPLAPVWVASAVILSALPTGALVFVLAQKYNVYLQRSTSVILISTLLSVVTVSAAMVYYVPG